MSEETGTPVRVMVVDDHPMWRDAIERDLVAAGFNVVGVAANGSKDLGVTRSTSGPTS
jgi:chemotaxis response regulator CheB